MGSDKLRNRKVVGSGQELEEKFTAVDIRASQVVIKDWSGELGWPRPQKALYCREGSFCSILPLPPPREK